MNLKLIPSEEIILKILYKQFLEDFEKAMCCPSDTIIYYRKDKEGLDNLFRKWLLKNEYATEGES